MADLRTERWAEHRVEMRKQLVAAAMRAIEQEGPGVSMRQIAAEAQVPKPTLYRFFTDKSELAAAIADQATEDIVLALVSARQTPVSTLGELLGLTLRGYVALLDQHPEVSRFLMFGSETGAKHALENSRAVAKEIASLMEVLVGALGGSGADCQLYASMIVGAVTGAADHWLGDTAPGRSMDAFVERVEPVIREICLLVGADAGVVIDFDAALDDSAAGMIAAMAPS
ncbi:putative transcriptional regulator, TetR family [Nocardia nova SH22a]|uniref:Putative transcriptional regulator, TetR family n=1 Tax=Nocardia nova SH22a TaxID=1415166 RepID=W5THK1_9NOCA|nr:TetR/AcrR family transcriptional regulator [Nocardia nova]AHH18448.1 putative transcriptional regulator, TetR family [Nocardia nova SH22a]